MEVHAHTHTPQKKWTHYFWEFLMLFLAVFCGFMAENQREHMVEHKREKQFIVSLINDLKLDIAWLDTVTNSAKSRIENLDSAIAALSKTPHNEIPVMVFQQLRKSTQQIMFFPNDGTVTQLKSSGGMRLIRKRPAVDSIENYDRLIRRLEIRREITNEMNHDLLAVLNKAFDAKDLLKGLYDSVFYHRPIIQSQAIKLNNQYVNELINTGVSLRLRATTDISAYNLSRRTASNLIDFLKKEYPLK